MLLPFKRILRHLMALTPFEIRRRLPVIEAIYFEYFEKWLRRVQPPEHLLDSVESFGYGIYFCREANLQDHDGPTHTLVRGVPGHGIPLRPIERGELPAMTDLIALPAQHVVPLS